MKKYSDWLRGVTLKEQALLDYGFRQEGLDRYSYQQILPSPADSFEMRIEIMAGTLNVEVYDCLLEEPYVLFSVNKATGNLVNLIRSMVEDQLSRLIKECGQRHSLKAQVLEQSQKLFDLDLTYPFKKYPSYVALTIPSQQRWFALLMQVPAYRLGFEGSHELDLLNLKHPPEVIESLLGKGWPYLPAYHMNKTHWISVVLDQSIEIEQLMDMLAVSYQLVKT